MGYNAGPDQNSPSLINATVIGAYAVVSESNALVLGGTGANAVKVGIGTATPQYALDVNGTGNFTGVVNFSSSQQFPGTGSVTSVASGAGLTGGPITKAGTLSVATGGVSNAMLANPSLTILPGTDVTGGGKHAGRVRRHQGCFRLRKHVRRVGHQRQRQRRVRGRKWCRLYRRVRVGN